MNKVSKKYKDSLSKKTVQELVEIIIRKDDKDKIKSKDIKLIESNIRKLKQEEDELELQMNCAFESYRNITERKEQYK